jgi:hypothetical protein
MADAPQARKTACMNSLDILILDKEDVSDIISTFVDLRQAFASLSTLNEPWKETQVNTNGLEAKRPLQQLNKRQLTLMNGAMVKSMKPNSKIESDDSFVSQLFSHL